MTFFNSLYFALAAAAGALSRYVLTSLLAHIFTQYVKHKQRVNSSYIPYVFPWGLCTVNLLGCIGFGFFISMVNKCIIIDREVQQIILVAFLGSFTTFSSFILELDILLKNKKYSYIALYIFVQVFLGTLAIYLSIRYFIV